MATSRITLLKDYVDAGGACKIIILVYIGDKQINISSPYKVTPRNVFFDLTSLLKKKYINKNYEIRQPAKFNYELVQYKSKLDLTLQILIDEFDSSEINANMIQKALKLSPAGQIFYPE